MLICAACHQLPVFLHEFLIVLNHQKYSVRYLASKPVENFSIRYPVSKPVENSINVTMFGAHWHSSFLCAKENFTPQFLASYILYPKFLRLDLSAILAKKENPGICNGPDRKTLIFLGESYLIVKRNFSTVN